MPETSSAATPAPNFEFVPTPLEDIQELTFLEYFLQLSFHTTDLHVTKGFRFVTPENEAKFRSASAERFKGSIVSSWVDMNRMEPPQSFESCVANGSMAIDVTRQLFETGTISAPLGFRGNPTGSYTMLLFKVALGKTLVHTADNGDQNAFLKRTIPQGYDSLELCLNSDPAFYNSIYRINSQYQAILYAAVQFEFTPVKIEVPEPICEMCETSVAQWYCPSDKAHFCNTCDASHHSTTPIFSRHVRIASSNSPVQFGVCEWHPSEVIDVVCLKCNCALCSHCILFDAHSDPSFFDHPLMSTMDAYECALNKTSESDICLQRRMEAITGRVKNRHNLLSQIYANFNNTKQRIDNATALLLEQLGKMKRKKIQYLDAIKREAETELLLIDWLEAFMGHLLLALNPADFIISRKKYDLFVMKMFGGECKINTSNLPIWMLQKLVLVGTTRLWKMPLQQPGIADAGDTYADAKDATIASDFIRPSLFDDTDACIGHAGGGQVDLQHKIDYILKNEPMDLKDLVDEGAPAGLGGDSTRELYQGDGYRGALSDVDEPPLESVIAIQQHVLEPVWNLLSEFNMATLLQFVRVVRVPEKHHLIRHLAIIANHFEEMDSLVTNACEFEMQNLCDNSLCMLMRSSSCLSELLSFICLHEKYGCMESIEWIRSYCECVHAYLSDASDVKQAADEATTHVVNKVVDSIDVIAMPSTLRFVLYFFAELSGERAASLCVDMLFGVLFSTHVARNIKHPNREALTEVSFLMGRIGIACWDAVETSSLEFCLASRLKVWMQSLLKRPRLKSKIHTRPTTVTVDSLQYVLKSLAKMHNDINMGTFDLPIEQINELTSNYNFIPLFEIASR
ncbi:B-box zinc finger domain-containing protein [Babesia divergens]|uniref:B-box zinc finger domain-containing protein n=1 Tax=Babesia divergens TaxID=32595 RepID=A0AAD9G940_BABDI|nr:B-box zinc finger domain-containing protein [Babesia divergens]